MKYVGWAILGLIGFVIAVPVLWLGSGLVYEIWNTSSYRYRLTLVVEADGQEHTGSSVVQVTTKHKANWLPQTDGVTLRLKGEAVMVDLGRGRYLFSLLKHPGRHNRIHSLPAYAYKATGRDIPKGGLKTTGGPIPVTDENIPLLVTFEDITDPASVKRVDPENLAATFGPGVKLKRITVETTQDPITKGKVEQVLGWLDEIWPNMLDGQRYETIKASNRFANSLATGDFSTEVRR